MNILLDTCDFLWFLAGDLQLPMRFREAFADASNQLFLSVASDWEVSIKYRNGKLKLPQAPNFYMTTGRQRLNIHSLPVFADPAYEVGNLPLIHQDPFDRMIIAQAITHQFILASSDPKIHKYPVLLL